MEIVSRLKDIHKEKLKFKHQGRKDYHKTKPICHKKAKAKQKKQTTFRSQKKSINGNAMKYRSFSFATVLCFPPNRNEKTKQKVYSFLQSKTKQENPKSSKKKTSLKKMSYGWGKKNSRWLSLFPWRTSSPHASESPQPPSRAAGRWRRVARAKRWSGEQGSFSGFFVREVK